MAASAPSPLVSSTEKTNGAKLSRLLIDGGTTVLKMVFDSHHSPANLAMDLTANYPKLCNLLKRRVLHKPQWDKLFPPGGSTPDSNNFDITLLFLLLTEICGLSPPPSGWHKKPPLSDTTLEANLARIKFFRNELYGHVSTTGIDSSTFSHLWREISDVLVALGLNKADVDRLKAEYCGEEDYLQMLFEWADSEKDLKSQLKEINQTIDMVHQNQTQDAEMLQQMKSELHGVCHTQTKIQEEVLEVKKSIEDLNQRGQANRTEEILNVLAKSEFKGDIEFHVSRFQEGTREWIFKKIEGWLDDRSSPNRVMVISGNAGMGKSVISAVTCKRMQEAGRLSGSHFCQHNNVRYRNPQLMLQSLASHLCRALPEYKEALFEQLSRNLGMEINSMGVEELFALLFKEPLSKITDPGRNLLLVLDALDESEHKGRNELLDVIVNHFVKLPRWIRFLVTTRPEVNISNSLSDLQPLYLETSDDDNKRDIRLFLEKQLDQVIPNSDKEAVLNALVEKSDGVILYAYFLVDFIQKNVPLPTPNHLDGSLPLGISSVYLSYFKRLEKEFCKELEIDEENFLGFLSVVMAAKEPLPLGFIPKMFQFRAISSHRKVNKVISCISTLLPVIDGRIHIFHKSVKDWLIDTTIHGRHEFTVGRDEGSQILSRLCETEFNDLKRKGIHGGDFSDTEIYALRYGAQHLLDVMGDKEIPHKLEELVENYVTDLELVSAKLCIDSDSGFQDILSIKKLESFEVLPSAVKFAVTSAITVMRKYKARLRCHPQQFFQAILNEGGPQFSSKANHVLKERYPEIPYIEIVNKEDSYGQTGIQARFDCNSLVACFDVSPEMDYMVCECVDKSIQLWSLQSGDRLWLHSAFIEKSFGIPRYATNCAVRNVRELTLDSFFGWTWESSMSFYRSVAFHPDGDYVIPGSLRDVFTLNGDVQQLFPESDCFFNICAFCGDRSKILTDCPTNPRDVVLWSMSDGREITRFECTKNMTSFAFSPDGTLVAISDKSKHISLYKLSNMNIHFICDIASPSICSLMHFSPDNQEIICGFLGDNAEFELLCHRRKVPSFCEDECLESASCFKEIEDVSWWPWECKSFDESKFLISESKDHINTMLSEAIPFFRSGFLSVVNKQTVVVCSPFHKEIFMIHHDQFEDCPSHDRSEGKQYCGDMNVTLSVDGSCCYIRETSHSSWERKLIGDMLSMVYVYFESKKTVRKFQTALDLLPVKEGVLLMKKAVGNILELWDFELSRCVRSFSQIDSLERLFPVSDELVGCQRPCKNNCSKVDVLSIANSEIVFSTMVEGNITSVACNSKFQFVACSEKVCRPVVFPVGSVITIAVWNKKEHLWKRNILHDETGYTRPRALISNNGDFVVTWCSRERGSGLQILNAATGITMHDIPCEHKIIIYAEMYCELLNDGVHFVCCCHDQVARLFHGNSGNLIGLIDMERMPLMLTNCLNKPLFAAVFERNSFRLFQVHLPKMKNNERKVKRLVA